MFDFLSPNWVPALLVFLATGLGVLSIAFLIESGREVKRRADFKRQLQRFGFKEQTAFSQTRHQGKLKIHSLNNIGIG